MEELSKMIESRICSNLGAHKLKIYCYKHSLVYIKHIVTTNRKSIRDNKEMKRKESKHNTVENYQHPRVERKRIRNEKRRNIKTIRKQLIK